VALGLLVLAIGALALRWIRREHRQAGPELSFVVVLSCALALNLLIAVVHTLDEPRYVAMQTPLFALLGYLASLVVVRSWAMWRQPLRVASRGTGTA
jgi:O-antigen/teichoic acid export membrane protein